MMHDIRAPPPFHFILLQRSHYNIIQLLRYLGIELARRHRILPCDLSDDANRVFVVEWMLAGDHLIEHYPQLEDVRCLVHLPELRLADLLWSGIQHSALHTHGLVGAHRTHKLAYAPVANLWSFIFCE